MEEKIETTKKPTVKALLQENEQLISELEQAKKLAKKRE